MKFTPIIFLALAATTFSAQAKNARDAQIAEGFAYVFRAEDHCDDLPKMHGQTVTEITQLIIDGPYHSNYDKGFNRFGADRAKSKKAACDEAKFIRKNVLGL